MSAFIPLTKSLRMMQEMRRLVPEMSVREAQVLLFIARCPGISQTDVALETGMSKGRVSTYVDLLGEREGRGFVSVRDTPEDRRLRVLRLTPAGDAFVKRLTEFL